MKHSTPKSRRRSQSADSCGKNDPLVSRRASPASNLAAKNSDTGSQGNRRGRGDSMPAFPRTKLSQAEENGKTLHRGRDKTTQNAQPSNGSISPSKKASKPQRNTTSPQVKINPANREMPYVGMVPGLSTTEQQRTGAADMCTSTAASPSKELSTSLAPLDPICGLYPSFPTHGTGVRPREYGDPQAPSPAQKKPCFKFKNSGYCLYGERCQFSHDPHQKRAQDDYNLQQKQKALEQSGAPSAPVPHAGNTRLSPGKTAETIHQGKPSNTYASKITSSSRAKPNRAEVPSTSSYTFAKAEGGEEVVEFEDVNKLPLGQGSSLQQKQSPAANAGKGAAEVFEFEELNKPLNQIGASERGRSRPNYSANVLKSPRSSERELSPRNCSATAQKSPIRAGDFTHQGMWQQPKFFDPKTLWAQKPHSDGMTANPGYPLPAAARNDMQPKMTQTVPKSSGDEMIDFDDLSRPLDHPTSFSGFQPTPSAGCKRNAAEWPRLQDHSEIKKQPCNYFLAHRSCPYGQSCGFEHDPNIKRPVAPIGPPLDSSRAPIQLVFGGGRDLNKACAPASSTSLQPGVCLNVQRNTKYLDPYCKYSHQHPHPTASAGGQRPASNTIPPSPRKEVDYSRYRELEKENINVDALHADRAVKEVLARTSTESQGTKHGARPICRNYVRGTCLRTRCQFLHYEPSIQEKPVQEVESMLSDPDISSTSGDDTDARLEAEDLTEYSFTTDSMDPTSPIWNATVEKASPGPLQKSDAVSNTARGGSEDITGPVKRKTDELVSGAYAEVTPEIVGGASIRKPVDTQHVDVKKPMEVRADTNTRKADAAQGVEARNLIEVPPDTNVRKVDGPQGVDVKSLMKVRPDTSNRKADASQGVEFEKRMEMVPHTNIRRADGSTGVEVEKIMEAQAGIRKAMNQQPKTSPTQGGQASRANVLLKQPPIAAEPPKRHDKPAAASSSDPSPKRVTVANISSVVQPPHIIKHVITVQPKHGHSSVQPGVAASRPLVKPTAKPHHSVKSASNDQPAKKDRFLRSLDNRSLSGAEQFQRPLNVRRMLGQAGPADLPSHWTPVTAEEGWYYGKRIMPEKKEEDEGRVVKTKETEKAKALFVLNMPYSSTPKDLNDMIEGFGLHPISAQFGYTKGGARTPLSLVRLPTEAEAEEAVARIQAQSNTKQWHNILATRTLMEWPSSVDKDERIIFRGGEDVFDVEEEEEEDVDEDEEGDEESGASTDSTSDLSESSELSVD